MTSSTKGKNDMNDGVAMLLERMKTNPEEFIGDAGFAYSKWGSLIGAYKEHLEQEDRVALTDALCKLHQQKFTEKVMEELINPKKNTITLTQSNWGTSATILTEEKIKKILKNQSATPIAGVTQTI